MNKKALIIGSPDQNIPGVKLDMQNYKAFLASPLGGYWTQSEIEVLENPKKSAVKEKIAAMRSLDYSMVVFAGHGYFSQSRRTTVANLNSTEEATVEELSDGANRHTVILDCCRVRTQDMVMDSAMAKAMRSARSLNASACRNLFHAELKKCPVGLVVMYGCNVGETAGDSSVDGGRYSHALLSSANIWFENLSAAANNETLPVTTAHAIAAEAVKRKDRRQNPQIANPRSGPYFPFAVVA